MIHLALLLFLARAVAAQEYVSPPTVLGQLPLPVVPYTFRPTKLHSTNGTVDNADALVQSSGPSERNGTYASATLRPNSTIVLDFGTDVGGYPVFDMGLSTLGQDATIRYTVSESLLHLVPGVGDGTGFAAAKYRYEVIYVSGSGERWLGRAVQGGQRFMLIEHIGGTASVVLKDVGFEAATDPTPIVDLPGSFNCSDTYLNDLWALGARTVQLGCTSKGTLPPDWQVSGIGTLIESKNVAFHRKSGKWGEIDASLSLYIVSGSTFIFNKGGLSVFDQTSQFRLSIGVSDITLSRNGGSSVALPANSLAIGKWQKLLFSARGNTGNATLSLNIDGANVGYVPYDNATLIGAFGFSADDGTAVIAKNVLVQDTEGNVLYSNSLTSRSALQDFATGDNRYAGCFDGAKRDRLVWAGDLSIFGGTIFYSTADVEAVAGSLLLFTGVQDAQGQISSSVPINIVPTEVPTNDWLPSSFFSVIYAISSANAWYEWYEYTGNLRFIQNWWPAIKRDLSYGLSFLNGTTGLIELPSGVSFNYDYYDGPMPGEHTSANSILVWALRNAALIADSLGELDTATQYRATANSIQVAVNERLYKATLGGYVVTNRINNGMSQDGNAYAILSGITSANDSPTSPQAVIEALRSLDTPLGPLAFSNATGMTRLISPYASGFHAWAAFEAGMNDDAIGLMRKVWKNQVDITNPYYTGMTWEFINGTTGEPYNPSMSSQAHGWGSGPTWQLSRYVLGVSPAAPGYSTWSFAPRNVNLTYANGRVPTPWGTIYASWETIGSEYKMRVTAPAGTNGTIVVPTGANMKVTVNGGDVGGSNGTITGVRWAGVDGDGYRVNVTSNGGTFLLSAV